MNWIHDRIDEYKSLSKHGKVTVLVAGGVVTLLILTGINCII